MAAAEERGRREYESKLLKKVCGHDY